MQNRSEETRSKIKRSAIEAFSAGGYEAASVADICKKAAISKGAFYHHFPSKHALFLSIMRDWLDDINTDLISRRQIGKDVPAQIRDMGKAMGYVFEAASGQLPMFLEFMIQANRDERVWEAVLSPYKEYREMFSSILQAGQAEQSIDEALNTDNASLVLMSLAIGTLLQGVITPNAADWKEVTTTGIRLLLQGIERKKV